MEASATRTDRTRSRDVCIDAGSKTTGELDADTARAMLSEMRGTPLRGGGGWDAEARGALEQFQKSEGLPPTGTLDDVTASRLSKRFEQFVGDRHATGGDAVRTGPTKEAHARVGHAVQEAVHAAENLAHQLGHDAPVRAQYVAEAKEFAKSAMAAFERGELTEAEAAFLASRFRNAMLVDARGGLSPAGAAISKLLKEEGLTLPVLMEKYAAKMYGKAVKDLSKEEVSAVCLKIAERAGVTNPIVNAGSKLAPHVGKALVAVAIAVSIYQVAAADDDQGMTMSSLLLPQRFLDLALRLGAHRDIEGVFALLTARYRESHRHRHTLAYVEYGLGVLDVVADDLDGSGRDEVELALWFHDAVYAAHPFAQNEARSAELAYESCLRMGLREERARRIATMIRATAANEASDAETALLVDIDLAVLGAEPIVYAAFERDVRREQGWVVLEGIYRMFRARVLRGLLARPSIYASPAMRERFEAQARANLEGALRELGSKVDEATIHADDEQIFFTRAGRLEDVQPWSDLYFVTHYPPMSRTGARLGVSFGPFDDRALLVDVDDPGAQGVVARLRALPGYRHEIEGRPEAPARLVYSRERSGRVVTPVRLPAPAAASAYR